MENCNNRYTSNKYNNTITMNIYKLKYTDKETAIADLIIKNVIDEDGNYINGTQAVVDIGLITIQDGTYDNSFNTIIEPIYADGYHYDIMTTEEINFENEIQVNNPKHTFAGH
jgi:hypothetical protein